MLRSRIIPCLLIHKNGLVKSVNFGNYKYVGDPINAVKIFNEKEVDELLIIDIDASSKNKEPNYELIKKIANESRMPLCYGGGITTVAQASKIISLGVEKVSISSSFINNSNMVRKLSEAIGKQSVVVTLDIKKSMFGKYEVYINNGATKSKKSFHDCLLEVEDIGIGELVINSIDNDGQMKGVDMGLLRKARDHTSMPLTVLGGISSVDEIIKIVDEFKIIGVSAGSLFVFKGPYKAVLISYLSDLEREQIIKHSQFGV